MKSKRIKHTKKTRAVKRQSKLLLKLGGWGNFVDQAYQLESMLAKEPKQLQIEFVGCGEIPADTALLMRAMIRHRSAKTRLITNARSSLLGATALIWLLGDARRIREDARLSFRAAGPFVPSDARVRWNDRCACEICELEEQDYIRVLEAINEFLPVKELVSQQIDVPLLKQFGLVDNDKVDTFLAAAFGRSKERSEKASTSRPEKLAQEAPR